MRFTKMHGIGNDYVYVDCFKEHVADPGEVACKISNRNFGIGSDGLILIEPSTAADVKMRMFNADGGESEMCGNGVRCVAKYAFDHGLSKSNPMRIETGRGVLTIALEVEAGKVRRATVNMGEPIVKLADIPVSREFVQLSSNSCEFGFKIESRPTPRSEPAVEIISHAMFVSMGNPHVAIFVDDVDNVDVARLGPLIENFNAFPKRINAHWVQLISSSEIKMRTWERGSGITLACGTGACAVCVAGVLMGKTDRKILAHLPGGDLTLEWREADNCVYKTGPATEVFSGEWTE